MTSKESPERSSQANGERGTLASSVYEKLRSDIMAGELKPGERLRSDLLRDRYEVGNSPMREALNRLAADGMVSREDQKGFRVADASKDALAELVKTRCWLEEVAIRQSIAGGGTEWEERLVLAFHRLSRTPRSSSEGAYAHNPDWETRHRAFHLALISGCGSKWLIGFCDQLNDQAERYRQLAVQKAYPKRNELDEHRAIFEAAIDGRADDAIAGLNAHYSRTVDIILAGDTDFLSPTR